MNKSVATIDAPEFINLQNSDISPFIKKGEVKVLYTGENRNGSYISKETAESMGKTLRGAPIVGYYRDDVGDFRDHGEKITWDYDDFKFECMTKPYGFVPLDAPVWFKKFTETDDFGKEIVREYLMTTCYLWSGQFEEVNLALEGEGRPHSMELDNDTLDGHWATNDKGIEFFIINDANITKLCILGSDVEPCFEGSSITSPNISTSFTKDSKSFINELREMIKQVEFAKKGGSLMQTKNNTQNVEDPKFNLPPTQFDGEGGEGGAGGEGAGTGEGGAEGSGTEGAGGTEGTGTGGTEGTGTETQGTGTEGTGTGGTEGTGNEGGSGAGGTGTGNEGGSGTGTEGAGTGGTQGTEETNDPVTEITAIAASATAGTIEGDVAQVEGQAITDETTADTKAAKGAVAEAEAALAAAEASGDAEAIAEAEAALVTAEAALEAQEEVQAAVEEQQEIIDAVASDVQGSDAAGSKKVTVEQFNALQKQYNELLAEVESLREYKLKIENTEKDAIIAKFSMLPEEILKEVSDNKAKYSVKELETQLKVLYFDNNVQLEKKETEKKVEPVTTFNLGGCESDGLPAWLKDVKATQERLNN